MLTFADLFCGGGLGARGAVTAGMQPMLAIDSWDIACQTYRTNFPCATVINDRIENIEPLDYLALGSIDLLLASPECTNHSVAKGAGPRDEKSRETAMHTIDWISSLRPRWFIIENVKEMESWSRYGELTASFLELGYKIRPQLINAADYGAPQARRRLFLIGGRDMPPPTITPSVATSAKTVRDILDPHGTWPETQLFVERRAASTKERARHAIKTLGSGAEFLLVYYGSGGEKSWQGLDQPLRTVTTVDRFALVRKKGRCYVMRMLQPTELARAMALPEAHSFPAGTRREKVKLCGNGVCATVTEAIVRRIREAEAACPPQVAPPFSPTRVSEVESV